VDNTTKAVIFYNHVGMEPNRLANQSEEVARFYWALIDAAG
jgi:hypothetical protein